MRAPLAKFYALFNDELAVRPDEVQQASLRALRDAVAQAGELLKMDCPTYRPITPVVRIETMEQRLDTMLRAINIVQPALQKFYGSLTDEQKERFNRRARAQAMKERLKALGGEIAPED